MTEDYVLVELEPPTLSSETGRIFDEHKSTTDRSISHYQPIMSDSNSSVLTSSIITSLPHLAEGMGLPRVSKWLNRVSVGVLLFSTLHQMLSKPPKTEANHTQYIFEEGNISSDWLRVWLNSIPETQSGNSFRVVTGPSSLEMRATQDLDFLWNGIPIKISTAHAENKRGLEVWTKSSLVLTIETRDPKLLEKLLQEIYVTGRPTRQEEPRVFVWSGYDGWHFVRPCPPHRCVILPEGQLEDMQKDLMDFMGSREYYEGIGIPWRRGYLLEGEPGSGKTSSVVALASLFKLNVCILSLTQIYSAEDLRRAADNLPAASLLLLEDIDAVFCGREGQGKVNISFSDLLNVLDGVATPDGRITFMTTNHKDKLDPALIRTGRVDRQWNFGKACSGQIIRLAQRFGASEEEAAQFAKTYAGEVSMSTVQEKLIELYHQTRHQ